MRIYNESNINEYIQSFLDRRNSLNIEIKEKVFKIINDVKLNGDEAIKRYTCLFDKVDLENIEVTQEELDEVNISPELLLAINKAAENIKSFHEKELEKSWTIKREDGSVLGIRVNAIERVGVYVPGGSAPLPSSVLMNIIPAKVAGVKEIIMCTPPQKDGKINPVILKAAEIAGADRIFKIGGAQAISAMAYGTNTVPKVYKITGPGNAFVAAAKNLVFGDVGIDMIAGPSEILICADKNQDSSYIAADLLSQAEHDKMAASILITTDIKLAYEVQEQLNIQIEKLQRKEIARESINNNGAIIVVDSIDKMVELSNFIAPEHLELLIDEVNTDLFVNAGAIFIGKYSPEPMGDYFCGTNHVLPTGGTAKFSSPLGVWDFVKRTSIINYTRDGFLKDAKYAYDLAIAEGLCAHVNSIRKRCDNE